MVSFKQFILESTVYRGVTGKYDASHRQDIIWVSTSKNHAQMYATETGEVVQFRLNKSRLNELDLGFRASETEVKFDEIRSRLVKSIMILFEKGKLNEKNARDVLDSLNSLKMTGHKQVWEWMHVPKILDIIKKAGFNVIVQREGLSRHKGDTITYGVLDTKILQKTS